MSDKRSVSTDALDVLGTILIGDSCGRDAIHLAVEPVIAGEELKPGQDVGLMNDKAWGGTYYKHVGIVDPFLKEPVKPGQKFLLVVYPRTITSLRHVWSHPDFMEQQPPTGDKAASEAWLKAFISTHDCPDYESVIKTILGDGERVGLGDDDDDCYGRFDGEQLIFIGTDAHATIPPEFWDHVEVVTGMKISSDNRPEYFSCSC
jgi:hypothetical protein